LLPHIALESSLGDSGCPMGGLGNAGDFPDASRTEPGRPSDLVGRPRGFPGLFPETPKPPSKMPERSSSTSKRPGKDSDQSRDEHDTASAILDIPQSARVTPREARAGCA
jgi:hypothetical protein